MMRKLLLLLSVMVACFQAEARDYSDYLDLINQSHNAVADFTINGLYYYILSPTEVMVVRGGNDLEEKENYWKRVDQEVVTVPSEVENKGNHYQVLGLGDGLFNCDNRQPNDPECPIREIVLSEGIEFIAFKAFYGLSRLQSVSLPNSLRFIGAGAFHGCKSLSSITIPEGIDYFSIDMFNYCGFTSLEDINHLEYLKNCLEAHIPSHFMSGDQLKSIRIPDWVESIDESAFSYSGHIEQVYIPNNVKSIGIYAFGDGFGYPLSSDVEYIGTFYDKNGVFRYRYDTPNPVVIIDNNPDLEIGYQAFGRGELDASAVDEGKTAPPTLLFLGSKPPVYIGHWIKGGWDDNPPLVFVPSGLKDAYNEAGVDGPESGVVNGLNEFNPSVLSSGKFLLIVRQATEGGKVKINGEELTGTQVLDIEEGSTLNIEFIPDNGYQLEHFYWNHNYQDETTGVLEDGVFKTVMTGNSRLDFFFTSTTGITPTKETDGKVQYYSVEGQRLSSPQKGITIIKTNDGKPKKVVTKGN